VRYICSKCGSVLYVFVPGRDYFGIMTFGELVQKLGIDRCPHCGKKLEKPRLDRVVIR